MYTRFESLSDAPEYISGVPHSDTTIPQGAPFEIRKPGDSYSPPFSGTPDLHFPFFLGQFCLFYSFFRPRPSFLSLSPAFPFLFSPFPRLFPLFFTSLPLIPSPDPAPPFFLPPPLF